VRPRLRALERNVRVRLKMRGATLHTIQCMCYTFGTGGSRVRYCDWSVLLPTHAFGQCDYCDSPALVNVLEGEEVGDEARALHRHRRSALWVIRK
jgi:hypothetical protein